jgi:hypothetical protein
MKSILATIFCFLLISTTPVKADYAGEAIRGFIIGVMHGWNVLFSDDECDDKECKENTKEEDKSDE